MGRMRGLILNRGDLSWVGARHWGFQGGPAGDAPHTPTWHQISARQYLGAFVDLGHKTLGPALIYHQLEAQGCDRSMQI